MLAIIRLRILKLRNNWIVVIIMMSMAIFLSFIFGKAFGSEFKYTVSIVDEDNSYYSEALISEIMTENSFKYKQESIEEAVKSVENGFAIAAIKINSGLQNDMASGEEINIGLIATRETIEGNMIKNNVKGAVSKTLNSMLVTGVMSEYMNFNGDKLDEAKRSIEERLKYYWEYRKPLEVTEIDINKENRYNGVSQMVVGMMVMFSMYTVVYMMGDIILDKKYTTSNV